MYTNPYIYMYIHALHTSVYMIGVHVSAPHALFLPRAPPFVLPSEPLLQAPCWQG